YFPNTSSEQSPNISYIDAWVQNRWHSLLLGVTESGVLFTYDLHNRMLLWQLPVPVFTLVVSMYPFRDIKGDWLIAAVLASPVKQAEMVFFNLTNGKKILSIPLSRLQIDPSQKVRLAGVDKLGRGFVDTLYLSTHNAVWKVMIHSPYKTDWYIQPKPAFFSETGTLPSKAMVTRSLQGKSVTVTQVMHTKGGDRIVQWLDDLRLCQYPITLASPFPCLNWVFASKGQLSNPVIRQKFIVISEQRDQKMNLHVLSKETGKIVDTNSVQWIYLPALPIRNKSYLNFTPQILLPSSRPRMQSILVQRQDGAIGLGKSKIDYEDLGRITWWLM
ncbi:MAG TPA: hypothetical protein VFP93_01665, partial [Gammaproteobacteria bacterium]|nr:hypothetical protein [Gammaproteobacteria bacterium]